jgi:hypothetical protein
MMKKTLFVCRTHEQALQKFNECVSAYDAHNTALRVSQSRLQIEFASVTYEFIALSENLSNKIVGRTFSDIIVDEYATLTPEQNSLLMSRKRDIS